MTANESLDINKQEIEQKQILYNEIRDIQIQLKEYCSQKKFELFLINKESKSNDEDIKNFKIVLKQFYIQQFFIQLSIEKIKAKFLYNVEAELTNDKEKIANFSEIINYSINFKEFIQLSKRIPINDLFQINLWIFSVIPSYFNFFLSRDDEDYFFKFLNAFKEDNERFNLYSSIIYYHPIFLHFCKNVFDPVFESAVHEDRDQVDPPSKFLQNSKKTLHLCPSIVQKLLRMIPESDRMNHFRRFFYEPMILFPHRFFVLPECYVLPRRKIQSLTLALENFVDDLVENESPLNSHVVDAGDLLFASFDLELIKFMINMSKRRISMGIPAGNRNMSSDQNAKMRLQKDANQTDSLSGQRSPSVLNDGQNQESSLSTPKYNVNKVRRLNSFNGELNKVPSFSSPNESSKVPSLSLPNDESNKVPGLSSSNNESNKVPSLSSPNNESNKVPSLSSPNNESNKVPSLSSSNNESNKVPSLSSPSNESSKVPSLSLPNDESSKVPSLSSSNNESSKVPSFSTPNNESNKVRRLSSPENSKKFSHNPLDNGNSNDDSLTPTSAKRERRARKFSQSSEVTPTKESLSSIKFNQSPNLTQVSSMEQNQDQIPQSNSIFKKMRHLSFSSNKEKIVQKSLSATNIPSKQSMTPQPQESGDSSPKPNFITGGFSLFSRKRSVSAAVKDKDALNDANLSKSPSHYKYSFIEVKKGKERTDVSELIIIDNFLNDSFSSEDISSLSSSELTREEFTIFFRNFKKLLQKSDILPILNFNNSKKAFDFIDFLYESLVSNGGSISTMIERAALFESIRQFFIQINDKELHQMIELYKKIIISIKSLQNEKESFNNYKKKTDFIFERTFMFYKLVFRLGDTFLFDESRRKTSAEIVEDPYSFYKYYQENKSIDPIISKIQYHAFIHNLRFYDFIKIHPELAEHDDYIYKYISLNQGTIIQQQPKSSKIFDKLNLIKNRFLFDPIIKNIRHAFEINAVPFEKYEIIKTSFEKAECWLRNVIEYGGDDFLPFTIFIFALSNPKKFISNSVFMYLFLLSNIWQIDQNDAPVVLTRLKSFIAVALDSFSELSSFLPLKTIKVDILYILDYSKLSTFDDNNQENQKQNYTCLLDAVDKDKTREIGKPFKTIYQDELPFLGELIFHDCSQNFSLNSNSSIVSAQNQENNENDNNIISNFISNIGQKKQQYDVLVIESDSVEFVRKAVHKNKNINKKIIFSSRNACEDMKPLNEQIFKIMPRFSLFKALKEILNLVEKIE